MTSPRPNLSHDAGLSLLDAALAAIPNPRFHWNRLTGPDREKPFAGFSVSLCPDYYPVITATMDYASPFHYQDLTGIELSLVLEPHLPYAEKKSGTTASHRRFPKTMHDVATTITELKRMADDFMAHRALVIPGARVLADGVEREVSRVLHDPQRPTHYKQPVVLKGCRQRYRYCDLTSV